MKATMPKFILRRLLGSLLSLGIVTNVAAHGDLSWNDITIDDKNDSVAAKIDDVKKVVGDVVLHRRPVTEWPDPELVRLQSQLEYLNEEVDEMLDHIRDDGVHLQLTRALRENPRAGRSVAASNALVAAIDLLKYIASCDSVDAFEQDLHKDGMGAYMFDLMEAYADNMGLYKELTDKTSKSKASP